MASQTYQGEIKRLVLVTDAWQPQINGVVRTLNTTAKTLRSLGMEVHVISPSEFDTVPCPTYPTIPLAVLPGDKVRRRITELAPQALHIATEGPLGWAARNFAVEMNMPHTTAYHTQFPQYLSARLMLPLSVTYRYLRWFHSHSKAIMVPTPMIKRDLDSYEFPNVKLWSRGVDKTVFYPPPVPGTRLERGNSEYPIYLYAGRVAVEKNIEAFLELELPGQKWVVGDGPALEGLKESFPNVRYFGFLNQTELAKVYHQANVFVFPSKTDTFGLVLLEAMATGLPVAAYPVSGPIDVVGDSGAGVLDNDLRSACLRALEIPSEVAEAHAQKYTWEAATQMFASNLQYIPPSVFVTSVRDWSEAHFMEDDGDLLGHLPQHLADWLHKTADVAATTMTPCGKDFLTIPPPPPAAGPSATTLTNANVTAAATLAEDPFILGASSSSHPSTLAKQQDVYSIYWSYLMVTFVGLTWMLGSFFPFPGRMSNSRKQQQQKEKENGSGSGSNNKNSSSSSSSKRSRWSLFVSTTEDGDTVGSITPPLSPASTSSLSFTFADEQLY